MGPVRVPSLGGRHPHAASVVRTAAGDANRPMVRSFLEVLRCPCCRQAFRLQASVEDAGGVGEGILTCPQGRVYPIAGGIPRIYDGALSDFPIAHPLGVLAGARRSRLASGLKNVQKGYSNWWTRLRNERLYAWDNRAILLNRTLLLPEEFAGKRLLDAGTGNGRFLRHFFEMGAVEVVAMDLSRGVDKARELNPNLDRCHFVQADLLEAPLADESFDGVLSIGVLHHTPDPRKGFHRLATLVRPGGFLSVFLYYQRWRPYDRRGFELLREFKWICFHEPVRLAVARMPHSLVVAFCAAVYAKALLVDRLKSHRLTRWAGTVLEQLTPPGRCLPGEGASSNIAWLYDGYSTRYVYQISLEEVVGWFHRAGYNDLAVSPFPLSITGWRRGTNERDPLRIRFHAPKPSDELESASVLAG